MGLFDLKSWYYNKTVGVERVEAESDESARWLGNEFLFECHMDNKRPASEKIMSETWPHLIK